MEDYKLKIDKSLLYEFLVADEEQVGSAHYSEVRKVIDVVLYKYYGAYKYMF